MYSAWVEVSYVYSILVYTHTTSQLLLSQVNCFCKICTSNIVAQKEISYKQSLNKYLSFTAV